MGFYRVTASHWPSITPGTRVSLWVRVPNPDEPPETIGGELLGFATTEHGTSFRIRPWGRIETRVPVADVVELFRRARD